MKDGESIDGIGDYSDDDSEYDVADTLFGIQELNRNLARKLIDAHKEDVIERCPADTCKDESIGKWVRNCASGT